MSKSIIEEALDSVDFFIEDIEETTKLFIYQAKTALEKAQKQEKLLKLYQRFYEGFDDLTLDEHLEVRKQIKEIEDERN